MSTAKLEDTQTLYKDAFADRRNYPRIKLKSLGAVRCTDGSTAKVTVHDIAPDGVQVRCDKETAQRIYPSGKAIERGETGPEVELLVQVRLEAETTKLHIHGTMIYFALINPELVAIGIKSGKLSDADRDALEHLISESLIPRE
jgi:hypothetical protein